MKKLAPFSIFIMSLLGLVLFSSCSKSYSTSPLVSGAPPNLQTPIPTNILSAFATIGDPTYFDYPAGIQYFDHHLWVANISTYLQEWTTVGSAPVTTIWTYNSGVSFVTLYGDSIDPTTGNVYACDEDNSQVAVFDPTGNSIAVFGSTQMGPTAGHSNGLMPFGVAVNSTGTTVYALSSNSSVIFAYSIGGTPSNPVYTYQNSFGNAGSGSATLNAPQNLRVDGSGNIWVADRGNQRVAEYSSTGTYLQSFKSPYLYAPADLLIDTSGNLFVVDQSGFDVLKFNSTGTAVGEFGQGVLNYPLGIATDGTGNYFVTNGGGQQQQIVEFH